MRAGLARWGHEFALRPAQEGRAGGRRRPARLQRRTLRRREQLRRRVVTILNETGHEREVTIVGVDELDSGDTRVSWRSPLARALLTAEVGDTVTLRAPRGSERLEIVAVRYDELR